MNKFFGFLFLLFFAGLQLTAQTPGLPVPGGPPPGFNPSAMNIGRFYGKIVDENGKGIGYATVRLYGGKFDPATRTVKDTLLAGQITADNGDFNLEKLPVVGDFTLKIELLGYASTTQTVTFGVKRPPGPIGTAPQSPDKKPEGGFPPAGGGFPGGNFEKDLGNIRLTPDSKALKEVVIADKTNITTLALDRKTYRVDKDLSAAGGTAQDALKNVPSLSVDLDGNVSLRNGAPQIFVDGRPTTLSLNQIAADAIESVEVITNPSAKFDAGGGTAGIVNIVLKKDRRLGYNGNVRLGADRWGGFNLGGDLNARGEKMNLFGSVNINRNQGFSDGSTTRLNLFENPASRLQQDNHTDMNGLFANGRAGVDFFLDNRNTLTLSGNYTHGAFKPTDEINTSYQPGDNSAGYAYLRRSEQDRDFRNTGASIQFKHLFPKKGAEWTADANYNQVRFNGNSDYTTTYTTGESNLENQKAKGRGSFFTLQSDLVYPLSDKLKIETGLRAALRTNRNDNNNSLFNSTENEWVAVQQLSDHYKFNDDVYAVYAQASRQFGKWGVQAGLRAESSVYKGALTDRDSSFSIVYPISLFPSLFVTRKLNEKDQLQLAFTRRVNRPNFFQTMPFTDFSDSLNLRRGNPFLVPEFTHSLELTYQKVFSKKHSLLGALYVKQATNLIAAYQFTEYNAELKREVVVTSYSNSDWALAYGAEVTLRNNLFNWLDLSTNLNVYQSNIDASNVESNLKINQLSAFLKETAQLKLATGLSLQINGEYRTRASYTPSNNNDPFRGGPGNMPSTNTAQGYTLSNWFVDASLKKDLWHNQASLSLSIQDIFATRRMGTSTVTDFFSQETERLMNPRTVRLNFMYRFGKMDASLFTRKNTRMQAQGNDML
jgi:outer membrane receptor protein involved in Fe transport